MNVDHALLRELETGMDTIHPERSTVSFGVVGYGEISTVFTVRGHEDTVYKRMPMFDSEDHARRYAEQFLEYSELLRTAGVHVPEQQFSIVAVPERPVVLYLAQPRFPDEAFCHRRVHGADAAETRRMVDLIASVVIRVRQWNEANRAHRELSIDGQLSNWVLIDGDKEPVYVDTSTPLYRKEGREQLDPELFLKSAPPVLRGIMRIAFLEEVLTRYYDTHRVLRDLAANLYKEGRPDLIRPALDQINSVLERNGLNGKAGLITERETASYYREDKRIWAVYLSARRLDRWIRTRISGRPYPFLLPGPIER